jgi:hypothetical protein
MKIVLNYRFAVARRQGEHGAADCFVAQLFGESAQLNGWRGGLGDLVQGQVDDRKSLELGEEDIGGQSEEPGGKAGFAPPPREATPGAEEGILGQVLGTGAIAAIAPGHIDERTLPAADDALKRINVSGSPAKTRVTSARSSSALIAAFMLKSAPLQTV